MRWYDFFALTYDRSLESLYRPYRKRTIEALRAEAGATVLFSTCRHA